MKEIRDNKLYISILSLYTEGDLLTILTLSIIVIFQSSPSIQRETYISRFFKSAQYISILSLYTEGDSLYCAGATLKEVFQSSPSIQRETCTYILLLSSIIISILSLYTEGDSKFNRNHRPHFDFNPLPLYRGRLQSCTIYYI